MVDWIDIDKNGGGSGETIVTITASTYSELVERTTSLTVRTTNTNLSKTVSITQMPREAITITVSPSSFPISRNGGRYYFNIVSNGYWEVVGYPSWVALSQTSGTGNATVYFTASTTDSITERTGYITLRTLYGDIEDNRVRVSLTQERAYQYIYVSPSELVFIYTGGSKTINVTTNGFWTASTESDWVTLSQTEGTGNTVVTVTVDDYLGEPKSAQIKFSTIDDEVYVDLTQYGIIPYLTFNDDTLLLPQVGGSETLRVNSNISWVIETSDDLDLPISVSTQTLVLPTRGGSNTFSITTDYGWTATTDSEWFTLSDTSGKGNGVITVTTSGSSLTDEVKTGLIKVSNIATDIYVEVRQHPDYSQLPFTVLMLENGYVDYTKQASSPLEYQLNDGEWTSVSSGWTYSSYYGYRIQLVKGDKLRLRSSGNNRQIINKGFHFTNSNIYGNIMSLLNKDEFTTLTTLPSDNTFYHIFQRCNIRDASGLVLPATTLTQNCYNGMFSGCTGLTTAPELPATTLADNCYNGMFYDCSGLTTAPSILPVSALTQGCYQEMFRNCRNLATAPELPATVLANNCYYGMFEGCTSLTQAPALPATTLADSCYSSMFYACSGLTTAPELPATTLANSCYSSMFSRCTSLVQAPQLPATTLVTSGYSQMFEGCRSLITAPELPATTLAEECYRYMFYGCSGLTTAPSILPATTLIGFCYYGMFQFCTSLTTAPQLPATTLKGYCYYRMFYGCRSLNYIKCLATDITTAGGTTTDWTTNVSSTGTFVKAASMNDWSTGTNGIPNNWIIQNNS